MIQYYAGMPFTEWIDASIALVGEVVGIPVPLAISVSLNASRFLLEDIKQWQCEIKITNFDNSTGIATLEEPDNASIYEILDIYVDERPCVEYIKDRDTNNSKKNTYRALSNTRLQFSEERNLDKRNAFIEAVLIPSLSSDGLATILLDQYSEGIKYKCMELIHKSPYPSFFDPDKSKFYMAEYMTKKRRYLRKPSVSKRDAPIARYGDY